MFGTVLTAVVTALHLYVLPLTGVFLWTVFVAGRLFGHDNPGLVAGTLELLTMDWMAVLFLCALCLLVVDLGTGFGRLASRHVCSVCVRSVCCSPVAAGRETLRAVGGSGVLTAPRADAASSYLKNLPKSPSLLSSEERLSRSRSSRVASWLVLSVTKTLR
jgi:hypothetical protein